MKIVDLFKGKGALIAAILATISMVLYAQFVLGHYSLCFVMENGPNSLGLTMGYSIDDALLFFLSRDSEQIVCYAEFIQIWDSIFPAVYTAMHIAWLNYFYKNKWLVFLLPIVHMVLDWSENLTELMLVEQYVDTKQLLPETVAWGSTLTSLKWIMSIGAYVLILVGIVLKVKKSLMKSK